MYKRPIGSPKSVQRLPARPVLGDLQHFLAQAMQYRGSKINIAWAAPQKGQEFMLSILCNRIGGDPEWRMYMGAAHDAKLLWFYVSNDVLLVYNLVVSSCGGDSSQPVKADGTPVRGVPASTQERTAQYTLSEEEVARVSGPASFPSPENPRYPALERSSQQSIERERYARPGVSSFAPDVTSPHVPSVQPPPSGRRTTLSGDLSLVQVTNLLPSMQMAKMTGRLHLESESRKAELYMEEGVPTHAIVGNVVGSEAVLELITWKEGSFVFEPRTTAQTRTIDQALDSLMLRGVQLIDNVNYLNNAGVMMDSVLVGKHRNLPEKDFERMLASGAPIDAEPQRRFYQAMDGRKTLMEIVNQSSWTRSQWVPVVANLVRCDLIVLADKPDGAASYLSIEPKRIDRAAIETVTLSLRRAQTGMFTYPAFLYFLEQEYLRRYRTESPVSVVLFELRIRRSGLVPSREPLPLHAVSEAARRISKAKRPIDLLCHYEAQDYALLLPNTKAGGANIFANRLVKTLLAEPFPGLEGFELSIAMGISSMPEDFLDMPLLLAGAEVARDQASRTNTHVLLFRDLSAG